MNQNRIPEALLATAAAISLTSVEFIQPSRPEIAYAIEIAGSLILWMVVVDGMAIPAVKFLFDCGKRTAVRFGQRDPDEMRATAYHEAGHALVAWFSPEAPPPKRATILRDGDQLGEIDFEDQNDQDRAALLAEIRVSLAGSAAEELQAGKFSSGSRGDLADANQVATSMVAEFGMSEALGPQVFDADGIAKLEPGIRRKIRKNVRKILDNEKKSRPRSPGTAPAAARRPGRRADAQKDAPAQADRRHSRFAPRTDSGRRAAHDAARNVISTAKPAVFFT